MFHRLLYGGDLEPTFSFNFMGGSINPLSTFTRASSATCFNSSGLLITVGNNVPRFCYSINTGQFLGHAIEGSRTNRALWCRDLTNAAWVSGAATAAKTQTGIDGAANSASLITSPFGGDSILQTVVVAAADRVFSAYVKRVTGSGVIQMTIDGGATWTNIAPTSLWQRYIIPFQNIANPAFGFNIVTMGDQIAVDYCQVEDGRFASYPILTTAAAVTRSTETELTPVALWLANNSGVIVQNAAPCFDQSANTASLMHWQIDDGTTNNRQFVRSQATAMSGRTILAGVSQTSVFSGVWTTTAFQKTAFKFFTNDFDLVTTSIAPATNAVGTNPAGLTTFRLGNDVGGAATTAAYNHYKSVDYYAQRLTNAQVTALTA